MTRSNPGILHPIDPEIDRTFHLLNRIHRRPSFTDTQEGSNLTVIDLSDSASLHSDNSEHSSHSDLDNTKNMAERTLKELATPDVTYQPLCIQYPNIDEPFELRSGLIQLLPKFHGLAGETLTSILKNSILFVPQ